MARTIVASVQAIIETEADIDLDPFIETAASIVDEVCEPLGHDEVRLELIERWLAAHFYAIRDPRRSQETAGGVSEMYQYRVGLNLAVTTYGQQAMMLDTKGGLARLNKGVVNGELRPGFIWLGCDTERGADCDCEVS